MEIEDLPLRDYTDSELKQQYSLTFKIANYYRGSLNTNTSNLNQPYAQLLDYANGDLDALRAEFQRRGISVPSVETSVETVNSEQDTEMEADATEKNEATQEEEEESTEHLQDGKISYETPVIVHKVDSAAAEP